MTGPHGSRHSAKHHSGIGREPSGVLPREPDGSRHSAKHLSGIGREPSGVLPREPHCSRIPLNILAAGREPSGVPLVVKLDGVNGFSEFACDQC